MVAWQRSDNLAVHQTARGLSRGPPRQNRLMDFDIEELFGADGGER